SPPMKQWGLPRADESVAPAHAGSALFPNAVQFAQCDCAINDGQFPTGFHPGRANQYRLFAAQGASSRESNAWRYGATGQAQPATYLQRYARAGQKYPELTPCDQVPDIAALAPGCAPDWGLGCD